MRIAGLVALTMLASCMAAEPASSCGGAAQPAPITASFIDTVRSWDGGCQLNAHLYFPEAVSSWTLVLTFGSTVPDRVVVWDGCNSLAGSVLTIIGASYVSEMQAGGNVTIGMNLLQAGTSECFDVESGTLNGVSFHPTLATGAPTESPVSATQSPTRTPTASPTREPSASPTDAPSMSPTVPFGVCGKGTVFVDGSCVAITCGSGTVLEGESCVWANPGVCA